MEAVVKGLPLYYEQFGSGRTILMLHASPIDHHHMISDLEPMFDHRSGWRRIYVDMPGHGRTPGADWIESFDDILDLLIAFIDEIAPHERIVLAGMALGSLMVRGIVNKRGAQIDGVMLNAPVIDPDPANVIRPPLQVLHEDPAFLAALEPDDEWIKAIVVAQNPTLQLQMRVSTKALLEADHAFLARIRQSFSFDIDALETPLPAPSLILTGRQDAVVGYQQAFGIVENYPRATFAVLDRAGHILALEQRGLYRTLTNEWLDRVEEYIAKRAQ